MIPGCLTLAPSIHLLHKLRETDSLRVWWSLIPRGLGAVQGRLSGLKSGGCHWQKESTRLQLERVSCILKNCEFWPCRAHETATFKVPESLLLQPTSGRPAIKGRPENPAICYLGPLSHRSTMDINGKQPLRQNAGARNTGLCRHLGSREHGNYCDTPFAQCFNSSIDQLWSSLAPKLVEMPQIQTICLALMLSLPSCY